MIRFLSAILAGALVLSAWATAYWMTIGRGAAGVIRDEADCSDPFPPPGLNDLSRHADCTISRP